MHRERVLSCIQPTGDIHLGNYLGAVKEWGAMQANNDCIYGIVDLHALTSPCAQRDLKQQSLNMAMDLVACGIDPEKTILFVQSHVPEHAELCWILTSSTTFGELKRMTQFKAKARDETEDTESVNAGLLNYPILQAADILMYKAQKVPVGRDQQQHVELARDIARRFNSVFGETFVEPRAVVGRSASVRSLADPEKKMSKSLGEKHYVGLMESAESIERKITRAKTDCGAPEPNGLMSPGVENLFRVLAALDLATALELKEIYEDGKLMYSSLKRAVHRAVKEELAPIRERREELESSPDRVKEILRDGAKRAQAIAMGTMKEVREKVGVGVTQWWI